MPVSTLVRRKPKTPANSNPFFTHQFAPEFALEYNKAQIMPERAPDSETYLTSRQWLEGNYVDGFRPGQADTTRSKKSRTIQGLTSKPLDLLVSRAEVIHEVTGKPDWINKPHLLTLPSFFILDRAQHLQQLFGDDSWKTYAPLFTMKVDTLQRKVENLDSQFGKRWHSYVALVGSKESTIQKNLKVAQLLGMDTASPGFNLTFLIDSPKRKRERAKIIREEILGNQNVRIFWATDETIDKINNLPPEEREEQKRQLAEFRKYIGKTGKHLLRSDKYLREKAPRKPHAA